MKNLLKSMTQGSQRAERFHEKQSAPPKPMKTTEATKRPILDTDSPMPREEQIRIGLLNAIDLLEERGVSSDTIKLIEGAMAIINQHAALNAIAEAAKDYMDGASPVHAARLQNAIDSLKSLRS